MGLLYGRAGCLTAENGGFWPGQFNAHMATHHPTIAALPDLTRAVGLGRTVASGKELPDMFANLV